MLPADQIARVDRNPTEGQKRYGNYRMGHVKVHGLPITIENPRGSVRAGVGADGKPWKSRLASHYGYLKRTEGSDGDGIDIFVGPHLKAPSVYVIDQVDADTGRYDEHKCFIGFASAKHAKNVYLKSFSDGKGAARLGAMTTLTVPQFKEWLKDGDTRKPLARASGGRVDDTAYDPMTGLPIGIDPSQTEETWAQATPVVKGVSRTGEYLSKSWPVEMVKSGATLPGDVASGAEPLLPPGLRREDFTDQPYPQERNVLGLRPSEWQPNDSVIERAQAMAGMAGGTAFGAGESAATKAPARAAVAMSDSAAPGAPVSALAKQAQPFYSAVERAVEGIQQSRMTGDAWLGTLRNKPGVKPEEMDWTGLTSFLEERKGQPVTKQEVADRIAGNKVELQEVVKGGRKPTKEDYSAAELKKVSEELYGRRTRFDDLRRYEQDSVVEELANRRGDAGAQTKYQSYQLPGGENYREMLLTLPSKDKVPSPKAQKDAAWQEAVERNGGDMRAAENDPAFRRVMTEYIRAAREGGTSEPGPGYRSSHWDEPNILAHMRMNDRTIDGKKSLHVEEIQSDFMQDYRAQKTAIAKAIDNDFDGIAAKMLEAGVIKRVCD